VCNQPWAKYLTKEDGTGGVPRNKKAYLTTNYETTNENTTLRCRNLFFDSGVYILLPYHTKKLVCPASDFNIDERKN
jgi:hypothetical protein